MRLGERRPHRGDGRLEAGLPERDRVGVALDDHRPVLLRDRLAGEVEAVEEVALAKEVALGGVDVLRAQRVVLRIELPRLEPAHAPARVGEREHQAPGEVVVPAAVDQSGAEQLVAGESLPRRRARERGAARGEAEPELAADLLAEVARGEVLARKRAALGLPQEPLVEGRRPVEQLEEPLTPLPRAVLLGRGLLVLELHAEPVAEPLDRADEVEVLLLLDERDRVAALAAAEALERAAVGRDAEARRPSPGETGRGRCSGSPTCAGACTPRRARRCRLAALTASTEASLIRAIRSTRRTSARSGRSCRRRRR